MTKRRADDLYLGAFLGLACGDALGAPVEFLPRSEVDARHGRLTEMVGGGNLGWAPGEWTDDTGMALCVAEGILARPEDPVQEVGERFLEWGKTAKDVGGTIAAALDLQLAELQPSGYAGYVLDCLEAAVWATVNTESLEDALVTLVNLGGETDTMAAVAGGALGAR